jgi:methionine-rich copper-binding protein CopC
MEGRLLMGTRHGTRDRAFIYVVQPPNAKSARMALRMAIAALFLVSEASGASARALLIHASPAAGSTVGHAPSPIVLSFSEALLPSGSDAVIRNATGGVVSSGKARVIGNKTQMEIPAKSLSPGKYRVEWYTTSTDRHQNQGSFSFVIGAKESVGRSTRPVHRGGH